jgi:hypothetical protein
MRPIRRILVAVKDPEARALPAIRKAAQLARACGAQLELFHALSKPWRKIRDAHGSTLNKFRNEGRHECRQHL